MRGSWSNVERAGVVEHTGSSASITIDVGTLVHRQRSRVLERGAISEVEPARGIEGAGALVNELATGEDCCTAKCREGARDGHRARPGEGRVTYRERAGDGHLS